jgi:hypothetical protein
LVGRRAGVGAVLTNSTGRNVGSVVEDCRQGDLGNGVDGAEQEESYGLFHFDLVV